MMFGDFLTAGPRTLRMAPARVQGQLDPPYGSWAGPTEGSIGNVLTSVFGFCLDQNVLNSFRKMIHLFRKCI